MQLGDKYLHNTTRKVYVVCSVSNRAHRISLINMSSGLIAVGRIVRCRDVQHITRAEAARLMRGISMTPYIRGTTMLEGTVSLAPQYSPIRAGQIVY